MKRDMDLVRRILMELADSECPLDSSTFVCEGCDRRTVVYHISIMRDAGLIKATVLAAGDDPYYAAIASELTWDGNDFLASVKSEKVWAKVKTRVANTVGDASLSTFKAVAADVAKALLMQQ